MVYIASSRVGKFVIKDGIMLEKQGLYLPEFEHDNCGAGFICSLKGEKSNEIIHKAIKSAS